MRTKAPKAHSSSKDMSPITHRYHKQDIVSDLAENSGLTKAQISRVLDEPSENKFFDRSLHKMALDQDCKLIKYTADLSLSRA